MKPNWSYMAYLSRQLLEQLTQKDLAWQILLVKQNGMLGILWDQCLRSDLLFLFLTRTYLDVSNFCPIVQILQEEAKNKYIEFVDSLVGPANSTESLNVVESSSPGFDVTIDGKLRIITLNKPTTKNAFTLGMYVGFAKVNTNERFVVVIISK